MATIILRPEAIGSSSGFNSSGSTLLNRINDNDTGTTAVQNQTSASIGGINFEDSNNYTGATIDDLTISIIGKAGRAGAATVQCELFNPDEELIQDRTLSFGGSTSQQNCSTITANLTPAIINGMLLDLTPNTQGITIMEVFVTVNFTVATGYGNKVNAVESIGKVNTVATGSIGKINTVD